MPHAERDGRSSWGLGARAKRASAPEEIPASCRRTSGSKARRTGKSFGDGDAILKDNAYGNPFWNETAFFKTDRATPSGSQSGGKARTAARSAHSGTGTG